MGQRRRRAAASDAVLYGVLHLLQLLLVGSDCNEQCDCSRAYCLQGDVHKRSMQSICYAAAWLARPKASWRVVQERLAAARYSLKEVCTSFYMARVP